MNLIAVRDLDLPDPPAWVSGWRPCLFPGDRLPEIYRPTRFPRT